MSKKKKFDLKNPNTKSFQKTKSAGAIHFLQDTLETLQKATITLTLRAKSKSEKVNVWGGGPFLKESWGSR